MNRLSWKWLLVISLSLNVGTLAAVAWNATRAPAAAAAGGERQAGLADHLKLSAEQRQRWSHIEKPFLDDLSSNWREIRSRRERLVRQIFSPVPDPAAIGREQERIAALQDAQQRRVISQLLAERALLDEHQRTALMELLLSRYAQEATEEERLHRD